MKLLFYHLNLYTLISTQVVIVGGKMCCISIIFKTADIKTAYIGDYIEPFLSKRQSNHHIRDEVPISFHS